MTANPDERKTYDASILGGAVAYIVTGIVLESIFHIFTDLDPAAFPDYQYFGETKLPGFLGMCIGIVFIGGLIGGGCGLFAWEYGKWCAKQGVTFYPPPFFWGIFGGFFSVAIIFGISLNSLI